MKTSHLYPESEKGHAAVIEEYIKEGSSTVLKELKEEVPPGLIPLLQLPGLGGKKIAKLYKALGIEDVSSLEEACRTGKVQALPGFGKKTEEKILSAIAQVGNKTGKAAASLYDADCRAN